MLAHLNPNIANLYSVKMTNDRLSSASVNNYVIKYASFKVVTQKKATRYHYLFDRLSMFQICRLSESLDLNP